MAVAKTSRAKATAKAAKTAKPKATTAKTAKPMPKATKAPATKARQASKAAEPLSRTIARARAQVAAVRGPREPVLEAAIRANRADADAYAVYADWLQANGSGLGELMQLQRALADRHDAAQARRADVLERDHRAAKPAVATWRWGLWDSLRIDNESDKAFDVPARAAELFDHPACGALRELRIGGLRFEHDHELIPDVLALAGARAWSEALESLVLGDAQHAKLADISVGDAGAAVSLELPNLRALRIRSGVQPWRDAITFGLAGLALPELESLAIETCSLAKSRLADVLDADLPSLTALELWFGSGEHEPEEGVGELSDLDALLAGQVFPNVVRLGLCNAPFTDDLVAALPSAPIAQRLIALDVSRGTLGDDAAAALAKAAKRFPRLAELDVDLNYLTPGAVASLRRAFGPRVTVRGDDQHAIDPLAYGQRWVTAAD